MPDYQRDVTLTGGSNDYFVSPGDYDYWLYNPPTNSSVTISRAGKAPILISAGEVFVIHLAKGEEIALSGTAGQTVSIFDHADVKLIPAAKDILGKFQLTDGAGGGTNVTVFSATAGSQFLAATGIIGVRLMANNPTSAIIGTVSISAGQTITVTQGAAGAQNWLVKQQGSVAGFFGTPTTAIFAGNATLTPGTSILKSAALIAGVAGATKVLNVGNAAPVSSKTGAAIPADLLDREVAVGATDVISLANGAAGDTVAVTYLVLP